MVRAASLCSNVNATVPFAPLAASHSGASNTSAVFTPNCTISAARACEAADEGEAPKSWHNVASDLDHQS